jgi:hypothetical protein
VTGGLSSKYCSNARAREVGGEFRGRGIGEEIAAASGRLDVDALGRREVGSV